MTFMKKFFLLFGIGIVLGLPFVVLAGPLGGAIDKLDKAVGPDSGTGLTGEVETFAGTVVKTALALVGTIFFLLTIYAGILWMTAGGDEENITKATSILKASVIGLIITLSAYAITFFVTTKLGGQ